MGEWELWSTDWAGERYRGSIASLFFLASHTINVQGEEINFDISDPQL